jgi:hypothetical protein
MITINVWDYDGSAARLMTGPTTTLNINSNDIADAEVWVQDMVLPILEEPGVVPNNTIPFDVNSNILIFALNRANGEFRLIVTVHKVPSE